MNQAIPSPTLSINQIQDQLTTRSFGRTLHLFSSLTSTNTVALTLAESGAPHGTVVLADRQTAGRGRMGRSWHSPPGRNIYCSVLITDFPSPDRLPWIPLATGLALVQALESETKRSLSVKWPNDVLLSQKKVAGILCERSVCSSSSFLVVGYGVNVNIAPSELPVELQQTATSLFHETGQYFDRNVLIARTLATLERQFDRLLGDFETIRQEYLQRCSTIGQHVQVQLMPPHSAVEGVAAGLSQDGALQLILGPNASTAGKATTFEIRAGEVVHIR
ncbi:MAG: biotin--[acetyl-CoA-carboxylase] ligase [Nitrospirae bacterium]|nr:MAG: biotin--[acetyl-CoA-carboxylase] ligase [Nitrospirota bacterium]